VVAATSDAGMTKADAEANQLRVNSTPTFAVTKNGKTTVIGSGVLDAAALQKALR
jgi:protein-disulfide isomerase-like protein with CxxC motif